MKRYLSFSVLTAALLASGFLYDVNLAAAKQDAKTKTKFDEKAALACARTGGKHPLCAELAKAGVVLPTLAVSTIPDYGLPNFSTSPPLRKFVDSLPGLGATNANNLGQYIPVATADTNTYPGSDYYEIGLQDYTQRMHSDLPATTKLRGYYQINGGTTADHTNTKPIAGLLAPWPGRVEVIAE